MQIENVPLAIAKMPRQTRLYRRNGCYYIAIGAAVTMILVLCMSIVVSEQSGNDARLYQEAWQENRKQYVSHNSTGENVFRSTEAFVRGFSGDPVAGFEIGKQVNAYNNQLQHDAKILQGAYASSSQAKDNSEAIAGLAILGLFLLATAMIARFGWQWRRGRRETQNTNSQPHTAGRGLPPPSPLNARTLRV